MPHLCLQFEKCCNCFEIRFLLEFNKEERWNAFFQVRSTHQHFSVSTIYQTRLIVLCPGKDILQRFIDSTKTSCFKYGRYLFRRYRLHRLQCSYKITNCVGILTRYIYRFHLVLFISTQFIKLALNYVIILLNTNNQYDIY